MSQTVTPSSNLQTFLGPNPGLQRIYDNVQIQVPSAALALIQMMTWNTIEDFYIQSTFKRELIFWTMQPGVSTIDFNPFDSNWLVCWLLDLSGLSHFTVDMPAFVTDTAINGNQALRTGHALLALKPISYNVQLPPDLFMNWFETIMDGVLGRLYMLPNKPFSSPQMATYHSKRYRMGVARARATAQANNTDGGGRWRTPYYARGKRKS